MTSGWVGSMKPEVSHEMRPGVGDVLGEGGDEVHWVEHLEVACDPRTDAAEQVGARRPGKRQAFFSARSITVPWSVTRIMRSTNGQRSM